MATKVNYSILYGLIRAALVGIPVTAAAGLAAGLPTTLEALQADWPTYAAAAISWIMPLLVNYLKVKYQWARDLFEAISNQPVPKGLPILLVLLVPVLALGGCASIGLANATRVDVVQTLPSDNPEYEGEKLEYHYKKTVPIFGKEKDSDGALFVKVQADGSYTLSANTAQTGSDNSGQVEGLQALGNAVGSVIAPFSPLIGAAGQAIVNRNPVETPEAETTRIEQLRAAIDWYESRFGPIKAPATE